MCWVFFRGQNHWQHGKVTGRQHVQGHLLLGWAALTSRWAARQGPMQVWPRRGSSNLTETKKENQCVSALWMHHYEPRDLQQRWVRTLRVILAQERHLWLVQHRAWPQVLWLAAQTSRKGSNCSTWHCGEGKDGFWGMGKDTAVPWGHCWPPLHVFCFTKGNKPAGLHWERFVFTFGRKSEGSDKTLAFFASVKYQMFLP